MAGRAHAPGAPAVDGRSDLSTAGGVEAGALTEPARPTVIVVGAPSPESDTAIARFFARFLEREHPGTAWRVRERGQLGVATEPATGKTGRGGAAGEDGDGLVPAKGEAVEAEPE